MRHTKPVGQDKGRLLGKVAVIEDDEELGSVLTETLQRVRHTAGEVPQVTLLQIIDEVAALVVESSDAHLTIKHVSPFGLLMPVKLTDDALVESHVDSGKLDTGGELADGCLSGPASFLQFRCQHGVNQRPPKFQGFRQSAADFSLLFSYLNSHVRVSKTPSHVGNVAVISARRADHVGALTRSVAVVRSQNRGSESVSPRLGVQLLANGIDVVVLGIAVAGSVGLAVFTVLGGQIHAIEQTLARAVEMRQSSCEAGSGKEQLGCGELHFCWQKLGYRELQSVRQLQCGCTGECEREACRAGRMIYKAGHKLLSYDNSCLRCVCGTSRLYIRCTRLALLILALHGGPPSQNLGISFVLVLDSPGRGIASPNPLVMIVRSRT